MAHEAPNPIFRAAHTLLIITIQRRLIYARAQCHDVTTAISQDGPVLGHVFSMDEAAKVNFSIYKMRILPGLHVDSNSISLYFS